MKPLLFISLISCIIFSGCTTEPTYTDYFAENVYVQSGPSYSISKESANELNTFGVSYALEGYDGIALWSFNNAIIADQLYQIEINDNKSGNAIITEFENPYVWDNMYNLIAPPTLDLSK